MNHRQEAEDYLAEAGHEKGFASEGPLLMRALIHAVLALEFAFRSSR